METTLLRCNLWCRRAGLIVSLALGGAPCAAWAQAAQTDEAVAGVATATTAAQPSVATGQGRIYEPEYFARYAPRNALDMVEQIPGFAITGDGGDQRGLGQASQNVLINGERLSSKSDSVRDQLGRIPAADVIRIEIVDGTTLDIPGLTGEVANIVVNRKGASGQFRWNTGFRAHNTEAQLFGGEVSFTGNSGALGYTVALSNNNDRFGADGFNRITDADGELIELQDTRFTGGFDNPKLSTNWTYRFPSGALANLNLSYAEDFFFRDEPEVGAPVAGPQRIRLATIREDGPEYEIGGDFSFALGPGRLKLIGLERFERDNFTSEVVDRFDDDRVPTGSRFEQVNGAGERIGRFEYGWRMFKADWQLSGEAAFNRLDRVSALFLLDPQGVFQPVPFPRGTGEVTEDRYEGSLSFSRQLTRTLGLQAIGGAEYSKLEQTGAAANSRSFQRPKGSVSLAWKPSDRFNASLEIARRVNQLSFGDFLASVALNDDNQNAGNNELVPYQSWNIDLEFNRNLGAWGSAKLELRHAWFEDFIDFFALPGGGEARGNIGDAQRTHLELNTLVKMDPIGWRGAQFDIGATKRWMALVDPFTGEERLFSNDLVDELEIDFRQDIPDTSLAYGAGLFTFNPAPYSRLFETGRGYEGPVFLDVFAEHKDVFGLTVTATAANILGARNYFERTVFTGPRPGAPILFSERIDQRIGPIFRLTVAGSF